MYKLYYLSYICYEKGVTRVTGVTKSTQNVIQSEAKTCC